MRLRADVGEVEEVLADWWQEFSMATDSLRADMVDQVREEQGRRVTRAPRPARNAAAPEQPGDAPARPPATQEAAPADESALPADAPRKRRRRRRPGGAKPAADGDAQGRV